MIQLTVWVPQGKGTKAASVAGDKFKAIFARKQARDWDGSIYRFKGMQTFTPDTKVGYSVSVFRISFEKDAVEQIQVGLS